MSTPDDPTDRDELATHLDALVARATGGAPPETGPPDTGEAHAREPLRAARDRLRSLRRRLAPSRSGRQAETGLEARAEIDALLDAHHETRLRAERALDEIGRLRGELDQRLAGTHATLAGLELTMANLTDATERIDETLRHLRPVLGGSDAAHQAIGVSDERLDSLYEAFEARFRGSWEDVRRFLDVYLDFVRELPERGTPALDIACGRGEWLSLLDEEGIRATGVDINGDFVESCTARGLDAIAGDAFEYLGSLPDESFGLATAFHFVEHLELQQVLDLLEGAYRVLRPGGALVLETPNPSNLRVGAAAFYLDPTHRRPVHPGVPAVPPRALRVHRRGAPVPAPLTRAARRHRAARRRARERPAGPPPRRLGVVRPPGLRRPRP
ncbi:MAG: class I SAM-dependent methyltransferase [Acidimicrobiia bacterium]|nr:class I SAM-dependent methyltransferase [Acidimicrobiia bacterium]